MELLKAIAGLVAVGGIVVVVTYGLGKIPRLLSKDGKKSCCD